MSKPLAIVPARSGSKGIPGKNFKSFHGCGGIQLWERALNCAILARCQPIVSSDADLGKADYILRRPPELAQDDTPMVDVVRHVLEQIPGPPDQPIVLLQPTQPLREPKHITQALALLTPEWDSVVSVVELPQTQSPDSLLRIDGDRLWPAVVGDYGPDYLYEQVTRRQDATTAFMRDGTCYAFHRRTVERHGNIYGHRSRPLIIPASETQSLDTPEDWAEAERRLREREATRA